MEQYILMHHLCIKLIAQYLPFVKLGRDRDGGERESDKYRFNSASLNSICSSCDLICAFFSTCK